MMSRSQKSNPWLQRETRENRSKPQHFAYELQLRIKNFSALSVLFLLVWKVEGLNNCVDHNGQQSWWHGLKIQITSDGSIWPFYVGVQSVDSRIETEAELGSWKWKAQLSDSWKTFLTYRGLQDMGILCLHRTSKQQLWWHHWLGNTTRMKMSLKRSWFILYSPRNIEHGVYL